MSIHHPDPHTFTSHLTSWWTHHHSLHEQATGASVWSDWWRFIAADYSDIMKYNMAWNQIGISKENYYYMY